MSNIYVVLGLIAVTLFFGIREILKDELLSKNSKTILLVLLIPFNVLVIIGYLIWRTLYSFKSKNHLPLILLVFLCFSCSHKSGEKGVSNESALTSLSLSPEKYNFGKIKKDTIYHRSFYVKNTGETDLKVINAISSCGCTIVNFERKSIPKGDSLKIDFDFDTHNRMGEQSKSISLFANTKDTLHFFEFEGNVIN